MNIYQLYKRVTRTLPLVLLIAALAVINGGPAAQAEPAGRAGPAPQDVDGAGTKIYLPMAYRSAPPTWMGPDGGSVVCMKTDPTNPNIVYAGTLYSGVYKSTNRGASWTPVNNGLGELFIDSLAVDPANGNIVYAGTHGAGVYKTVNGGGSWFPVNNGIANYSVVYTLAVNPGNSNLVYAGTRIQGTYYTGILYKSVDGGASWSNVMEYSDDWVYSVAASPTEPNMVLAAVHYKGPYYSEDYGNAGTWQASAPPNFGDDYLVERWQKARAVAFDPRGWMRRAHYTAWHDGMVSYSTNNGVGWRMSSGELGDSHIYPNGISIRPDAPDTVYLSAHYSTVSGVLRSTNAGASYTAAGLRGKTVYSVAALSGGDSVLAGTYLDGLYKSDNGGASWYYSMSGIVESNVTGMVFPGGNTIYASTKSGGGVLRSLDGGKTWTVYNTNLGDIFINGLVMHPTKPNILYALTNSAGLRRIDTNAGSGWAPAGAMPMQAAQPVIESEGLFAPPAPPDDALAIDGVQPLLPAASDPEADGADPAMLSVSAPVLSMTFAPSNSETAYLGTNGAGVYRSTDGGLNWTQAGLGGVVVRGVAVRPNNAAAVYAATNQDGVLYISTNSGASWQSVGLPDPNLSVFAVATLPKDPGTVFVGTSNGIYRYDGASWAQVGAAGTQVQVFGYNRSAPDRLYAGTPAGVYHSITDTRYWMPLSFYLQNTDVASLNFNPADPAHLYVGSTIHGTAIVDLQ